MKKTEIVQQLRERVIELSILESVENNVIKKSLKNTQDRIKRLIKQLDSEIAQSLLVRKGK